MPTPSPGAAPSRTIQRYVAFLGRHTWTIALAAFALFLASGFVAWRWLELRTDKTELLPPDDPTVKQLRELGSQVGAPTTLVVVVESDDRKANERFADALAVKLRPLVGKELYAIEYRTDAAKDFFKHNQALYAALADLVRVEEDFEGLLLSKKNPAYVALDDPEEDLKALKAEIDTRAKGKDPFPTGYSEGEDGRLLAMNLWTITSTSGDADGFAVQDHVQALIDALGPQSFGKLKVRITGDVARAVEEDGALKADLQRVSLYCVIGVLTVLIVYFRSLFALCFVFLPTFLGIGLTAALTALSIGYLNENTMFLGSIILGNGINFGIILLARFKEERRKEQSIEDALARAVQATLRPTLVAGLAASISYASLVAMRFRGFAQFGFVGGMGMALCWVTTYTHGVTIVLLVERWFARRPRPAPRKLILTTALARVPLRFPWVVLGLTCVPTAFAALACLRIAATPFDYDMRKLGNLHSSTDGAGALYVRVGAMFPSDITPVAMAIVDIPHIPAYRKALLESDCADGERRKGTELARDAARLAAECTRRVAAGQPTGGILDEVRSAQSDLPGEQEDKMVVIRQILHLLEDPALDKLSAEQRKEIDAWAPPKDIRVLSPGDLPEVLARRYRERNGTVGRLVSIFPRPGGFDGWNGRELMRLQELVSSVRLPDGQVIEAVAFTNIYAAMLRSIAADGPRASALAFLGVALFVVLFFRRVRASLLVLGSLLVGIAWMAGLADWLGLRFNFVNFVAFPVTLGIGVDYAVNMYARLATEPLENYPRAVAETGGAVTLCSLTTIIGYSSLLMSDSGALRSLGKIANLGEIGCLMAALLIVPTLMAVSARRTQAARAETERAQADAAA